MRGLRKLVDAALKGQSASVLSLLSSISEDKKRNNLANQALRWAAGAGHADLVRTLLDYGALPDRKDGYGNSALMYAAMRGHTAVARVLLSSGAYPDVRTPEGVTALMLACGNNQPDVVRVLIEHGADAHIKSKTSNETALMMAAESGCLDAVVLFVEQGVSVEDKTIGGAVSGYVAGLTPLMFAAAGGQPAVVDYLLSHGADPDVSDADGHTASWWAARNGHSQVCTLLG